MNIFFSKMIKAGERRREFNFRKLPGEDMRFHVDVTDDRGSRVIFQMYKNEEGRWCANTQNLPVWIDNPEEMLGSVIEEEYRSILASINAQERR